MQPKLYRDTKAISQSLLKEVARSPRKFEAMYLLGTMEWKQSDAMDLGSLVDMMLLTPKEVGEAFVEIPVDVLTSNGQKRGKKWDEFEAANEGKTLMKAEQFQLAAELVERVKKHPLWVAIEKDGYIPQRELYWEDAGTKLPCKALVDIFPKKGDADWIVDLKTTESMDDFESENYQLFVTIENGGVVESKSVANFGYHVQAAFYLSGASRVMERPFRKFFLLVVETKPPHRVKAFRLADEAVLLGQSFIDKAFEGLADRLVSGDWSERGENGVLTITCPAWAFK